MLDHDKEFVSINRSISIKFQGSLKYLFLSKIIKKDWKIKDLKYVSTILRSVKKCINNVIRIKCKVFHKNILLNNFRTTMIIVSTHKKDIGVWIYEMTPFLIIQNMFWYQYRSDVFYFQQKFKLQHNSRNEIINFCLNNKIEM